MSAPAYESYKDSGVEWLGQVPSHWELPKFKLVVKERTERSIDGTEELLSVSAYTGVTPRQHIIDDGDHLSRAESLEGYKNCYPGDLVMNIMLAWNRGLGVTKYAGIVSPAYCVFKINSKANPSYIDYLSRSDEYIKYFKSFSSGVIDSRLRLYPDAFSGLVCALPSLAEQTAIAAFLDRETGKIDALIEAQTRLIELLKEKRQAVISHAVTKGLNPDAPMKESGIEWLGQVPAHWDVKRLSYLFSTIASGTTPPSDNADYYDGEINWVTTGELREKPIRDTSKKVSQLAIQMFPTLKVYSPGTLLIAMYGATIGRLGWLEAPAATNQACCAFSDPLNTEPRYVYRYLQAVREAIILMATGGGQPNISQDKIRSLPTCSPPLDEQVQIADYLDKELSAYDDLEAETVKTISLLQERRAALISAAVTGKIDVRGLVNIESEAA